MTEEELRKRMDKDIKEINMFEKEAEEYRAKRKDCQYFSESYKNKIEKAFKDGAEFGYNKAKEWHYPSKGEMPTDEKTILIYLEARFVLGWYKFGFWYSNDGEIEEDIIAWKEIALPELPKELDK